MREPWFWREATLAARAVRVALSPASLAYDAAQRARFAMTRPFISGAPVFCVGAATLGGVGKTPFALLLAERLRALGRSPHFLTRGYGGSASGPLRVDPDSHTAEDVGDEALLLAATAPTWVARRRPAGAAAIVAAGGDAIVMDDGFQNPTIAKSAAFLLLEASDPEGNGAIFPAGPLRETVARAAGRAQALVLIGDGGGAPPGWSGPLFRARMEPDPGHPSPRRVVAFCGIGRPERFFRTLESAGFEVAARFPFPDHHRFSEAELERLRMEARRRSADLITTHKDVARLGPARSEGVLALPARLRIDDEAGLDALLRAAVGRAFGGARQ